MSKLRPRSSRRATFSNVVSLTDYRERHVRAETHRVFYLTDPSRYRNEIVSLPSLLVEGVSSQEILRTKLLAHSPDLALIESTLSWIEPVSAIRLLANCIDAPLVMICDGEGTRDGELIKQAYAAGVHDTLYAPLCPDELLETLEVLLKYRRSVSQHQ